ncbi:hypothetical protein [Kitasatospora atroaurantiaca]|nr:hypothetical protein [Kitasatospora atroaurantiaca]
MAVELPSELQFVLELLGLKWPQANEDELVKLADQLTKLASTIDSTQMAADKALTRLGEVYHGASADKLAELWGSISKYSGMVVEACGTTAKALNAAALVIEVCKGETLAQLVTTQAELAAASSTGPWSTAAVIRIAKEIVSRILEQAVAKLGKALAEPVSDLAETAVRKVTGSAVAGSNGQGFGVDLAQLGACALELRHHADDMDTQGNSFRRIVDGLDVGNPGDMFGKLAVAAAEQIAKSVGEEVLKRVLGSFRDTANRMDLVARNLTENEDTHTREMNGGMAWQTPTGPGGLRLAGGAGGPASGGSHDAGLAAFEGLRPKLGQIGAGGAGGADGHGGLHGGLNVLGGMRGPQAGVPAQALGEGGSDLSAAVPRQQLGLPGGLGRVSTTQENGRAVSRKNLEADGGRVGAEQSGGARQPVMQTPGMLGPVQLGQGAGGSTPRGQGAGGQIRAGAMAQQRSESRTRRDASGGDPTELLAEAPGADPAHGLGQLGRILPTRTDQPDDA